MLSNTSLIRDRREVIILTPCPMDPIYNGRWRDILARLKSCLSVFQISVINIPWNDPLLEQNIQDKNILILPLLAWGYQRLHSQWLEECKKWEDDGLNVMNAPAVLSWNSDKRYLEELRKRGYPVVPSLYAETFSYALMENALRLFDSEKLVVKPAVSATAYKTYVWAIGDILTDPPEKDCIVQPYLISIEEEGEISLIFIDGRYSHALKKIPKKGDFRVQPEFDGVLTRYDPAPLILEAAHKIFVGLGTDLLYARIDMIQGENKEWLLLEAELIEPDLFLELSNDMGEAFGRAVRKLVDVSFLKSYPALEV